MNSVTVTRGLVSAASLAVCVSVYCLYVTRSPLPSQFPLSVSSLSHLSHLISLLSLSLTPVSLPLHPTPLSPPSVFPPPPPFRSFCLRAASFSNIDLPPEKTHTVTHKPRFFAKLKGQGSNSWETHLGVAIQTRLLSIPACP